MQRQALQPRNAGDTLQGQIHCRCIGHDRGRGYGILSKHSFPVPQDQSARGCGPGIHHAWPIGRNAEWRRGGAGKGGHRAGKAAVTLSGGEAQRVKLATELAKRDTGKTFYILDEPTTGLHFEDIHHLLEVLNKLVDRGNTVLVIEHNMDVIKVADHIIDLGPEGGDGGGKVLFEGTPEAMIKIKDSFTAQFLREELK